MIELPEYAWHDIAEILDADVTPFIHRRTLASQAMMRVAIDKIIEIADYERGRQQRESMVPSRSKERQ
jgi:hypothetical protein